MKRIKKHWRVGCRLLGILLIVASLLIAYWWVYLSAPFRHISDPVWGQRHSQHRYWEEFTKCYARGQWPHDAFQIGIAGDKAFLAMLMSRIKPGDDISGCDFGHLDVLFPYLTNQEIGPTGKAWLAWWNENRSRSQEEWIRAGFAARGTPVRIPPSHDEPVRLLTILGNTSTNDTDGVPSWVEFNAFRWLRDSDFDPIEFIISNKAESTAATIARGLHEYRQMEELWPRSAGVGVLALRGNSVPDPGDALASDSTSKMEKTAWSLMCVPLLIGVTLIWLAGLSQEHAPDRPRRFMQIGLTVVALFVGFLAASLYYQMRTGTGYGTYFEVPGTEITLWLGRNPPRTAWDRCSLDLQVQVGDDFVFEAPLPTEYYRSSRLAVYQASTNVFHLADSKHHYTVSVDGSNVTFSVGPPHDPEGTYLGTFNARRYDLRFHSAKRMTETEEVEQPPERHK